MKKRYSMLVFVPFLFFSFLFSLEGVEDEKVRSVLILSMSILATTAETMKSMKQGQDITRQTTRSNASVQSRQGAT